MALTVTSGMWTGVPAPILSDQWLRCDSAGGGCIEITNATGGAYTPVAADEGSTIRVRVTATNGSGSISVASPQTPPVAAPSGTAPDVAPPTPPTVYTVPAGAISVSTSPQLIAALTQNSGKDIVLADGVYDSSSYFNDSSGNHLYAEHLGMARLNAGMALGKGAIVDGLVFDVSAAAKAVPDGNSSVLSTWGPDVQVLDTVVRGHTVIEQGLLALSPGGLVVRRCEFFDLRDFGIYADANNILPYGSNVPHISAISDVYVDGVTRPTPGSSNGTAEAGVEVGEPVDGGVTRIKVRDTSWMGLEAESNSWNTTFSDLDIDMSGFSQYTTTLKFGNVGVYFEHYSYYDTLTDFRIAGARLGTDCEWNDPAWGGHAACHFVTIANGVIDAAGGLQGKNSAGVYLDTGTESTTVTNVVFQNQTFAGIVADGTSGANSFDLDNYSGMAAGSTPVSYSWMPT